MSAKQELIEQAYLKLEYLPKLQNLGKDVDMIKQLALNFFNRVSASDRGEYDGPNIHASELEKLAATCSMGFVGLIEANTQNATYPKMTVVVFQIPLCGTMDIALTGFVLSKALDKSFAEHIENSIYAQAFLSVDDDIIVEEQDLAIITELNMFANLKADEAMERLGKLISQAQIIMAKQINIVNNTGGIN